MRFLYLKKAYWAATAQERKIMREDPNGNVDYLLRSNAVIRKSNEPDNIKKIRLMKNKVAMGLCTEAELWHTQAINEPDGVAKEIARAKVQNLVGNLSNYDLQVKLINLTIPDAVQRELAILDKKLEFNMIDDRTYEHGKIDLDLTLDADSKTVKKLKYDNSVGLCSDIELAKGIATCNREPFIAVSSVYDPKKGIHGLSFSFEWNDFWVKVMHDVGYRGESEEMMNTWFMDICRSALLEESLNVSEPQVPASLVKRIVDDKVSYIS